MAQQLNSTIFEKIFWRKLNLSRFLLYQASQQILDGKEIAAKFACKKCENVAVQFDENNCEKNRENVAVQFDVKKL